MNLPTDILAMIGVFTGEKKILRETCWMLYNAIRKPKCAKINIDCQHNLLRFCRTISREQKILENMKNMKFTISISYKIRINDVSKLSFIPHIKELTIDGLYSNFYECKDEDDIKYYYNEYNINGYEVGDVYTAFPKVETLCLKRIQFDRLVASRITAVNLKLIKCDTLYYAVNYLPCNVLTIRGLYMDSKNPDILSQINRITNLEYLSVVYMHSITTYLNTIPSSVKVFDINAGENSILGICNEFLDHGAEIYSVVSNTNISNTNSIYAIKDGRDASAYILYLGEMKIIIR